MKKLNIIFINKDGSLGGSSQSLYLLLKSIKDTHNVSVILCQAGPFIKKLISLNVPVYLIPFKNWGQFNNDLQNFKAILQFRKFLKNKKIDIIHSNSYEVNPLMAFSTNKTIKTICHVRTLISAHKAKRFLLHRTGTIITTSNAIKTLISFINFQVEVINDGMDIKHIVKSKNQLSQYIKKESNLFKVGIIGDYEENKQYEVFIKAALQVCEQTTGIDFFITGNNKTDYQENIIPRLKNHKKHFCFIKYHESIHEFMKGLDVIVVALDEENFNYTATQSMLCKKPVIGVEREGVSKIIVPDKTGYLFNIKDYNKLSEYILFYYRNKKKVKEHGKNGYNKVIKLFTLDKYVNSILRIYLKKFIIDTLIRKHFLLITINFKPQTGGIARWAYEEYKRLSKNADVTVIDKIKKNAKKIKNVYYLKYGKDFKRTLKQLYNTKPFQEVVFFYWEASPSLYRWLKQKKIPYTIILHGWEFLPPRYSYKKFIKKCILKWAKMIWVTSPYIMGKVLSYKIPEQKVKLIVRPINRAKFKEWNKEEIAKIKKSYKLLRYKIILSVGRLVETKDFFTILRSIKLLKKSHPNILYVLIGNGALKEKIINFIQINKLQKNVLLIDKVSDNKILEWYNISDVFYLTPREINKNGEVEDFNTIYHEAHYCGLPVIGSNTSGVKFPLSLIDKAYMIQPGNYRKLALLIKKLI